MSGWDLARNDGKIGTGNWEAWGHNIEPIKQAAKIWKEKLDGIEKPWLCWCLDDEWSILQQKIVLNAGWTPIVGNDTNVSKPTILDGSVYINFNETLKLPTMWMHFPLEFAFLFCEKLAFWHSDLLCSEKDMAKYNKAFSALKQGELAAVKHTHGWLGFKDSYKNHYGELLGCTTREASEDQFKNGSGWWRHISKHPNFDAKQHKKTDYYYEHGTGIWVWEKVFSGKVIKMKVNEKDGHASARFNNQAEKKSKSEELSEHSDLKEITQKLGLSHLFNKD